MAEQVGIPIIEQELVMPASVRVSFSKKDGDVQENTRVVLMIEEMDPEARRRLVAQMLNGHRVYVSIAEQQLAFPMESNGNSPDQLPFNEEGEIPARRRGRPRKEAPVMDGEQHEATVGGRGPDWQGPAVEAR